MFTVEAFYAEPSKLSHVRASQTFATEEARDAAIAAFPKWVKVKPSSLYAADNVTYPTAVFQALMIPTKGNEVNETGVKRVKKFLDIAGEVTYRTVAKNSVPTLDDVLALI